MSLRTKGNRMEQHATEQNVLPSGSLACRVGVLARSFTGAVSRILQPFGVTPSQAHLYYEVRNGALAPTEIARAMGVEASSVSRLLGTMEKRGLVHREIDASDRTRINVSLTAAGASVGEEIDFHAGVIQGAVERALTPAELAQLEIWIERVARELQGVQAGDR